MKNTKIEWTDHTFNPWIGCTRVSPGCLNCYAETQDQLRFSKTLPGCSKEAPVSHWGKGAPRYRTKAANWEEPVKWNREAAAEYMRLAHQTGAGEVIKFARPRVFCASLADWLDEEVPVEWLADLLDLIRRTPMLDWLLLTKRPENWNSARFVGLLAKLGDRPETRDWLHMWLTEDPRYAPANVWIGTTVEDQTRADERIPALLRIPARVRFLSCEPLLGPVRLPPDALGGYPESDEWARRGPVHPRVDWVICGGESGHGARPLHPDWARSLRDQCQAAGVAFFFKQHGEWLADNQRNFTTSGDITWGLVHQSGAFRLVLDKGKRDWAQDPAWRDGESGTTKVGKSAAGRLLDGREWNEMPGGAS